MKCEQEENKDKWRSFSVLSVFLASAILFGPFSHGSKIHISPRLQKGKSHCENCHCIFFFLKNYCRVVWLANSFVFHHIPLLSPLATGHLCTGQIEASTSPPGKPRAFDCASCPGLGEFERCLGRVGNLNQIYL